METRANYVIVGTFVLICIIGLFIAVLWVAGSQFREEYTYYRTYFTGAVTGLGKGTVVRYNGIDIGHAYDVAIDDADPKRVIVTLQIDPKAKIHVDSIATLESQGLTGAIYVEIEGGTATSSLLQAQPGQPYPVIPWDTLDLDQFNLVPKLFRPLLERHGTGWGTFRVIPIESGRGCPYGCEFCTVTGFFGDSIRFRSNESVVDELLLLKRRARKDGGQVAVFFIDDNFAINKNRTKSLLRDIIAADAQLPWVAQISANLLRDEELVDLIAQSGGKWIFIGMESIDPANLADVNKNFNKPDEYAGVLGRLAARNVYAITSFIFGMDNDSLGVAERTLAQVESWPPGLPIFGQLTPFPATPLYDRLQKAGRLVRPKHWLDFAPFEMAHAPLKMTIREARQEVDLAWSRSYSAERNAAALKAIEEHGIEFRVSHFIARLFFRGIYFPQMNKRAWIKLLAQNRGTMFGLAKEAFNLWRGVKKTKRDVVTVPEDKISKAA